MIKISIIIATYNWPEALELILLSLIDQLEKHTQVELILADDGSGASTQAIIDKYQNKFKHFKHVWHEDNGFRKSIILNQAVNNSKGEYLIFLDGDCIPFPDYITQQISLIEEGVFVAGNRVLLSKDFTAQILKIPTQIQEVFTWSLLNWLQAKLDKKVNKLLPSLRLGNGKWRHLRRNNWKYPKGCNFALSRKDFLAVNGFDEVFSGWGHEDADLFIRLLHNAVKIKDGRFAVPVLHLWHKESPRDKEHSNYQRLMDRLNDGSFTQAELGIRK